MKINRTNHSVFGLLTSAFTDSKTCNKESKYRYCTNQMKTKNSKNMKAVLSFLDSLYAARKHEDALKMHSLQVFKDTLGDGGISSSGPGSSVLASCLFLGDDLLSFFSFLLLNRWKRNNLEEALIVLLFEESGKASASHSCIIKVETLQIRRELTLKQI